MRRRSFVRPPLTAGVVKRTGDIGDSRAHTRLRAFPLCARDGVCLARSSERRTVIARRAYVDDVRRRVKRDARPEEKVHRTSALALARTPLFQSLCLSLSLSLTLYLPVLVLCFATRRKESQCFRFSLSLSSLLVLRLARSHAHSRTDKKKVFSVPLSSRHN